MKQENSTFSSILDFWKLKEASILSKSGPRQMTCEQHMSFIDCSKHEAGPKSQQTLFGEKESECNDNAGHCINREEKLTETFSELEEDSKKSEECITKEGKNVVLKNKKDVSENAELKKKKPIISQERYDRSMLDLDGFNDEPGMTYYDHYRKIKTEYKGIVGPRKTMEAWKLKRLRKYIVRPTVEKTFWGKIKDCVRGWTCCYSSYQDIDESSEIEFDL